jgi:hypothetical protein
VCSLLMSVGGGPVLNGGLGVQVMGFGLGVSGY